MRKYRNQPTVIDNLKFDSRKEGNRYLELKIMERAGIISDLQMQVSFPLTVNGMTVCKYICDFSYLEGGKRIVEDVKSEISARNPAYRIKSKLMKAVHAIEIRET